MTWFFNGKKPRVSLRDGGDRGGRCCRDFTMGAQVVDQEFSKRGPKFCLRNDLYCVGGRGGVKLYSLTHSPEPKIWGRKSPRS